MGRKNGGLEFGISDHFPLATALSPLPRSSEGYQACEAVSVVSDASRSFFAA